MASITTELETLRTAVYGEDVRAAFINSLTKINEEAEDAIDTAEDAMTAADQAIATIKKAIEDTKTATSAANTAASNANQATSAANTAATNAQKAADNANSAANDAEKSAQDANEVAASAAQTVQELQQAADNIPAVIEAAQTATNQAIDAATEAEGVNTELQAVVEDVKGRLERNEFKGDSGVTVEPNDNSWFTLSVDTETGDLWVEYYGESEYDGPEFEYDEETGNLYLLTGEDAENKKAERMAAAG